MKVYLASRYSRRDELRGYRDALNKAGITVTSRWLDETEPLDGKLVNHTPTFWKKHAEIDIEDVERADALIFFAESPETPTPRGGRHVEFGVALALNKPIYVISPHSPENIFHYLGDVTYYKTFDDFLLEWNDYKI